MCREKSALTWVGGGGARMCAVGLRGRDVLEIWTVTRSEVFEPLRLWFRAQLCMVSGGNGSGADRGRYSRWEGGKVRCCERREGCVGWSRRVGRGH